MGKSAEDKAREAVQPEAPEVPTPVPADTVDTSGTKDEFRERQQSEAKAQNLQQDNAVPERRPQAFMERTSVESPLTKRLKEEGALPSDEPMPKSAYDRAEKGAEKEPEEGRQEAAHVGTVVEVLDGPHRGRFGAVLRVVSYPTIGDRMKKAAGTADSDYVHPEEVEVAFRGDDRDGERAILNLGEIQYRVHTDGAFSGRAFVSGASA